MLKGEFFFPARESKESKLPNGHRIISTFIDLRCAAARRLLNKIKNNEEILLFKRIFIHKKQY